MVYLKNVFEIDNIIGDLIGKTEIERSQLELMFNCLMSNENSENKDKLYNKLQIPFRIAFDYFCMIEDLIRQLERCSNTLFDEAREASFQLEAYDDANFIMTLNEEERRRIVKIAKTLHRKKEAWHHE